MLVHFALGAPLARSLQSPPSILPLRRPRVNKYSSRRNPEPAFEARGGAGLQLPHGHFATAALCSSTNTLHACRLLLHSYQALSYWQGSCNVSTLPHHHPFPKPIIRIKHHNTRMGLSLHQLRLRLLPPLLVAALVLLIANSCIQGSSARTGEPGRQGCPPPPSSNLPDATSAQLTASREAVACNQTGMSGAAEECRECHAACAETAEGHDAKILVHLGRQCWVVPTSVAPPLSCVAGRAATAIPQPLSTRTQTGTWCRPCRPGIYMAVTRGIG